MSGRFLEPRSGGHLESGEAVLAARGMPRDLLRQASHRLELASLVMAAVYAFTLILNNSLRAAGWELRPHALLHNVVGATIIAVSMIVAWLSRRGRLEPTRLLDLGLIYEVAVAFGIALQDNLAPLSSDRPLDSVSWLCLWIVIFPVLVPAQPAKAVVASLAAASTWPLAFYIGLSLGVPSPAPRIVAVSFLKNYTAAILALVPTLVIRRLGADVQKAREMGSYELVEPLGRGGMGEVWRARHKLLARPAAIKLIRAEALGLQKGQLAERMVRRFEREAQATAALNSPHSVELYDFGVTGDGTFYYVMEILHGLDLETLVRRFGAVPADRVVHLLLQACDSLADAHHAGLIHRGHQAREHLRLHEGPQARFHQGAGLRPRHVEVGGGGRGRPRPPHPGRDGDGHARLHGPGARAGQPSSRWPGRSLRPRLRRLLAAHRAPRLRGGLPDADRRPAHPLGSRPSVAPDRACHPRCPRGCHPGLPGEGTRGATGRRRGSRAEAVRLQARDVERAARSGLVGSARSAARPARIRFRDVDACQVTG